MRGPLSGDYILDSSNTINNKAIKNDYVNDNDIVIIGLDQDSYENIGRFYPYDRGLIWSRVVDNLVDAGVKVIVFDIMFDHITNQDSLFSQSIKNAEIHGVDVILAANNKIETGIANQDFRLIKPSPIITKGINSKLGLVGTISDSDGFIRRYIAFDDNVEDSNQDKYYSLAIQAVMSFKNKVPKHNIKGIEIGNLYIPYYNNENTFLINYYGPSSYTKMRTFNTIPVHDILDDGSCYPEEGDCDPILKNHDSIDGFMELFTMDNWNGVNPFLNKIAIIGSALKEHHDVFETPFNSFQKSGEMYGLELHANVIQQIFDNNHINDLLAFKGYETNLYDKAISFILNSIFAFFIFFIITYLTPVKSIILSFLLILFWFNISIGAFLNDYLFSLKNIF